MDGWVVNHHHDDEKERGERRETDTHTCHFSTKLTTLTTTITTTPFPPLD